MGLFYMLSNSQPNTLQASQPENHPGPHTHTEYYDQLFGDLLLNLKGKSWKASNMKNRGQN